MNTSTVSNRAERGIKEEHAPIERQMAKPFRLMLKAETKRDQGAVEEAVDLAREGFSSAVKTLQKTQKSFETTIPDPHKRKEAVERLSANYLSLARFAKRWELTGEELEKVVRSAVETLGVRQADEAEWHRRRARTWEEFEFGDRVLEEASIALAMILDKHDGLKDGYPYADVVREFGLSKDDERVAAYLFLRREMQCWNLREGLDFFKLGKALGFTKKEVRGIAAETAIEMVRDPRYSHCADSLEYILKHLCRYGYLEKELEKMVPSLEKEKRFETLLTLADVYDWKHVGERAAKAALAAMARERDISQLGWRIPAFIDTYGYRDEAVSVVRRLVRQALRRDDVQTALDLGLRVLPKEELHDAGLRCLARLVEQEARDERAIERLSEQFEGTLDVQRGLTIGLGWWMRTRGSIVGGVEDNVREKAGQFGLGQAEIREAAKIAASNDFYCLQFDKAERYLDAFSLSTEKAVCAREAVGWHLERNQIQEAARLAEKYLPEEAAGISRLARALSANFTSCDEA